MKMVNSSSQTLIFLAIAIVLTFSVPLKAKEDERREILIEHNRARAAVGVAPLKWRAYLARAARSHVGQKSVTECKFEHSEIASFYGENMAKSYDEDLTIAEAVRRWVAEKSDYFYDSNTCRSGKYCHSYTQVVWRNTEWVGCSRAKCRNNATYVTCNYYPPGNIIALKPY